MDLMENFNESSDDTEEKMIERMEIAASEYNSIDQWASVYFSESREKRIRMASHYAGNFRYDEFSQSEEDEIDRTWAECMTLNAKNLIEIKNNGFVIVHGQTIRMEDI